MPYFKDFISNDACIVLSGLLAEEKEAILHCAQKEGFSLSQKREKNSWIAIELRYDR